MTAKFPIKEGVVFGSDLHEDRFHTFLYATEGRSDYFSDDKFYQAMIYLLTSDYLIGNFESILSDGELLVIDHKADISMFSSTEKFMMKYALSLYFSGVGNDYDFAYWFSQLDRKNQRLMLNSLKFLEK